MQEWIDMVDDDDVGSHYKTKTCFLRACNFHRILDTFNSISQIESYAYIECLFIKLLPLVYVKHVYSYIL